MALLQALKSSSCHVLCFPSTPLSGELYNKLVILIHDSPVVLHRFPAEIAPSSGAQATLMVPHFKVKALIQRSAILFILALNCFFLTISISSPFERG